MQACTAVRAAACLHRRRCVRLGRVLRLDLSLAIPGCRWLSACRGLPAASNSHLLRVWVDGGGDSVAGGRRRCTVCVIMSACWFVPPQCGITAIPAAQRASTRRRGLSYDLNVASTLLSLRSWLGVVGILLLPIARWCT